MKSTFSYLIIACFLLAACNKDSVNTRPSLTLKSVSPDVVQVNGGLELKFTFGDKESDIDTLIIYRTRLNIKKALQTLNDSTKLKVTDYDKNTTGEININFPCVACTNVRNYYQDFLISAVNPPRSGTPPKAEADTMSYKIIVKDRQKNVSDTIYYSPIVILRQ